MADSVNIGHSKWLFVLVICFSGRNALCDPTLEMLHNVIGYRSESVKIPCTYTPSEDYEEFRVEWLLWNEEIIYRIESKDNIPLVKFRDRVTISDSPGDVSLTIRKLNFGDKGNIKCKVTWKKNDGTKTTLEKVTVLEVKRTKPPTEKPKKTTIPTTTHGKPETIEPTTEKPKEHIFTTAHREVLTKEPSSEKPKENFITTIHQEWKAPFSDFSTESVPLYTVIISNAAIPQKKGFSMPLYILIAIIVCIVCVIIVVITLIIKNRRRKGYIYELPTMNQLLALEGGRNQCQSSSDETRASNNYEMCSPSSVAVYEGMLLPFANEYDVLAAENKSENNCF